MEHLSIIIPTYNRSQVLAETLSALKDLDGSETATWIVIDNNSTDGTRDVIRQFETKMRLEYLFESRAGKNCALNNAIERCSLGDVVVFIDDDITPAQDWLMQIRAACESFPLVSVFGGRIFPTWPKSIRPGWASNAFVRAFAFAEHDLGDCILPYPNDCSPFGGNFWIRRAILERGIRFNEDVGPRPQNRIMGSESTFLSELRRLNYSMIYYPQAQVYHRIQESECSSRSLRKRAFRLGRGEVFISGLPRPELKCAAKPIWHLYLVLKICYACALFGTSLLSTSQVRRVSRSVDALRVMGNAWQSLLLS